MFQSTPLREGRPDFWGYYIPTPEALALNRARFTPNHNILNEALK